MENDFQNCKLPNRSGPILSGNFIGKKLSRIGHFGFSKVTRCYFSFLNRTCLALCIVVVKRDGCSTAHTLHAQTTLQSNRSSIKEQSKSEPAYTNDDKIEIKRIVFLYFLPRIQMPKIYDT